MRKSWVILCLILLVNTGFAENKRIDVSSPQWRSLLLQTKPFEQIEVNGLLDSKSGQRSTTSLRLRPKRISDTSSIALVHSANGMSERTLPRRHYFEGHIAGDLSSRVLLVLGQDGATRGLVRQNNSIRAIVAEQRGLKLQEVNTERVARPFGCGSDRLPRPPMELMSKANPSEESPIAEIPAEGFLARIAIETDYEYYQRFGNIEHAVAYAMDLTAFASTIYADEVSTRMAVSAISIWTEPNDPWQQTGLFCRLLEFGKYWNDNRSQIDRSVAQFLSGTPATSGVAWTGPMCATPFIVNPNGFGCPFEEIDNYGGDYGFSGGISGSFDLSNPAPVWDIIVFAHEIGHNFSSPHTHCYANVGGNPNHIDLCVSQDFPGCYQGPTSLPGPVGQGSGTIMSYCHLQPGGFSNMGLTLGLDHPYGIQPGRVPDRMMAHVINLESANPGCFTTQLGPALYLNTGDANLIEGESLQLTLGIDQAQASAVTVDLAQSASLGSTFSNLSGHTIPANQQEITIQLPTRDDGVYTAPLSGEIRIDRIDSLIPILSDASLRVAVEDNDARAMIVRLSLDVERVTEGGIANAIVFLNQATQTPVEVAIQVSDSLADLLKTIPLAKTIPAGQFLTIFTLEFAEDDAYQQSQTSGVVSIGTINSQAPTSLGTPSELPLTFLDNDLPDNALMVDSFEGN